MSPAGILNYILIRCIKRITEYQYVRTTMIIGFHSIKNISFIMQVGITELGISIVKNRYAIYVGRLCDETLRSGHACSSSNN